MKKITKLEAIPALNITKKLRVAAYCRVSTSNDEQLDSLDTQKTHYERYIQSNDEWEFAGVYYDEGITGTKKDCRDGLQRMIRACEEHQVDLVITKSISRFSRNTTDCLELVRKLMNLNVTVIFEKENINTATMEDELMLSILSSLAESESRSISDNAKWAAQKRFQNGTFIISYPPYGYRNVDGKMVIDPEQAKIVQEIFHLILSGKSADFIAKELNNRGVPSPKGCKWLPGVITKMIRNEKYIGEALFQKTYTDDEFKRHRNVDHLSQYLDHEHHDSIVSRTVFDKANELLTLHGKEKGIGDDKDRYSKRYAFSGKIVCGECGSTMKRRHHYGQNKEEIAWACRTHLNDKDACSMKSLKDENIKTAYIIMMNKLIFSKNQTLKPLLRSLKGLDDQQKHQKIKQCDEQIEKNVDKKHILASLASSGMIEPAVFKSENNALLNEEKQLLDEREQLINSVAGDLTKIKELEKLIKFVSRSEMITEFNDDLFTEFSERITVNSRHEIVFELKCGLKLKERITK